MAKKIVDIKNVLNDLYIDNLLLQKIDCSNEDNKKYKQMLKDGQSLPYGVYEYKMNDGQGMRAFFTIYKSNLTHEEKLEYILLKQARVINTIKSCMVFFTAITVISMVIFLFMSMSLL